MSSLKLKYFASAALSMLFILNSCGENVSKQEGLKKKPVAANVNAALKKDFLQPKSKFGEDLDAYFYDPKGKRNPFEPYKIDQGTAANIAESPLEKYQLAELSLVGIIWGIADPRGMVKAPDGETYVVRRLSRIGRSRGKVSRVAKGSIYVEEEYRDPATGKIALKETKIELEVEDNLNELSGGLKSDG